MMTDAISFLNDLSNSMVDHLDESERIQMGLVYHRICEGCGNEFTTTSSAESVCLHCKAVSDSSSITPVRPEEFLNNGERRGIEKIGEHVDIQSGSILGVQNAALSLGGTVPSEKFPNQRRVVANPHAPRYHKFQPRKRLCESCRTVYDAVTQIEFDNRECPKCRRKNMDESKKGRMKNCAKCGTPFLVLSNRALYCQKCRNELSTSKKPVGNQGPTGDPGTERAVVTPAPVSECPKNHIKINVEKWPPEALDPFLMRRKFRAPSEATASVSGKETVISVIGNELPDGYSKTARSAREDPWTLAEALAPFSVPQRELTRDLIKQNIDVWSAGYSQGYDVRAHEDNIVEGVTPAPVSDPVKMSNSERVLELLLFAGKITVANIEAARALL
jgi:hypothetical protein